MITFLCLVFCDFPVWLPVIQRGRHPVVVNNLSIVFLTICKMAWCFQLLLCGDLVCSQEMNKSIICENDKDLLRLLEIQGF